MEHVEWLDNRREDKIDDYEERLNVAYKMYIATVEHIAKDAKRTLLVPYLEANGWEFNQGNGTWLVSDPNASREPRDYSYDKNDELPDWLDRLMRLEIDGAQGNPELALWMIDYSIRKTKNGGGQI